MNWKDLFEKHRRSLILALGIGLPTALTSPLWVVMLLQLAPGPRNNKGTVSKVTVAKKSTGSLTLPSSTTDQANLDALWERIRHMESTTHEIQASTGKAELQARETGKQADEVLATIEDARGGFQFNEPKHIDTEHLLAHIDDARNQVTQGRERAMAAQSAASDAQQRIQASLTAVHKGRDLLRASGGSPLPSRNLMDIQTALHQGDAYADLARKGLASANHWNFESKYELQRATASVDLASAEVAQMTTGGLLPYERTGLALTSLPPSPKLTTSIERYPNLEAPDSIVAGIELVVQVSLTKDRRSEATRTEDGGIPEAVVIEVDPAEAEVRIEVVLWAEDFDFRPVGSSNSQTITIQRDKNSTIALFHLIAKAISGPSKSSSISATFYRGNAFLARIRRPIQILASNTDRGDSPKLAASVVPAPPRQPLDLNPRHPSLTIEENPDGSDLRLRLSPQDEQQLDVIFPNFRPPDRLGEQQAPDWIKDGYSNLSQAGRGLYAEGADPRTNAAKAQNAANAFGDKLWDKVPAQFKEVYWDLKKRTPNARLYIQIVSGTGMFPWELMRPTLRGSDERETFLALTADIARWVPATSQHPRPPQEISLQTLTVIAPQYDSDHALPAATAEVLALSQVPGYASVQGSYLEVTKLATDLPAGVVHFAGHGASKVQNGVPHFLILLSDKSMDPDEWQSLHTKASVNSPLIFFNACDVGAIDQFMNEIDGWAPILLATGAAGYIGALWPISDRVASVFAIEFYKGLEAQLRTGEANVAEILTNTRKSVFDSTGDPTALAYILYADPQTLLISTFRQ